MTMQVGMVGTDGVLLASDTLWQNTESNQFSDSRDTTHGTKIEKNYRDGIAVACARNMELASQIAKDLISEMGSDDWESPETHVLQIANKVLERAVEQRREFQCTIITTKAQRQIFKLHAGMSALHHNCRRHDLAMLRSRPTYRSTLCPGVLPRKTQTALSSLWKRRCGCAQHWQCSYSDHDTQECGAAGTDRDDSDDGSFGVEFCSRR
jgi:hypothetical protein